MIFGTRTSPYLHAQLSVGQVMAQVIYALIS